MSAQFETASVGIAGRSAITAPVAHARVRLDSIDILRGLVIVLMVLDHARDFFGQQVDPLDLTQTTASLFLTRWITHFCAPTFVLLAGVSAWLMSKHMLRAELSRFLIQRGLWLMLLELTVVNLSWSFNFEYRFGLLLQVIWAIGLSMVVLAGVIHLPMRAIFLGSVAVIAGHNLLDGIGADSFGVLAPLWTILHAPGSVLGAYVAYPLLPWAAVMSLGYAMGSLFDLEPQRRRELLTHFGIGSLAIFVLLRLPNVYGDPSAWATQDTLLRTLLSFVNVEKYPPSLQYLLVTLGAAFLLLSALESARGRLAQMLRVFGRVPLFFYLLHLPLLHFGSGLLGYATGFGGAVMTNVSIGLPESWGYGLPVVYAAWGLALLVLYPACKWFGDVKRRHPGGWLTYI